MRAPRSEFHNLTALRGRDDARRFTGDHRLVTQRGEQIRFHDLPFDDRRGDAQHRLARKHQRPLGHGPCVAGKAEFCKVVEEFIADVAEYRMAAEISDFVGGEMYVSEKLVRLFESRRYKIISPGRKMTYEQLECGAGFEASLQIPRRHGELVKIG